MNVNEAIRVFNKKFADREVKEVYEYKGTYMLIAPTKGAVGRDYTNPIYLIDDTKKIVQFVPGVDFDLYKKLRANKVY